MVSDFITKKYILAPILKTLNNIYALAPISPKIPAPTQGPQPFTNTCWRGPLKVCHDPRKGGFDQKNSLHGFLCVLPPYP